MAPDTPPPPPGPSWPLFCGMCALLALVPQVLTQRFLYADGCSFFLQNLAAGQFSHWDWPRQVAHHITQAPFVAAMALGVRDIALLAALNGLGLYGAPLLCAAAAVWFTPPARRHTLVLLALAWPVMAITTSDFIISESMLAAAMACALGMYVAHVDADAPVYPSTYPPLEGVRGGATMRAAAAALMAVLSWRIYESFAFFGPPIAALALVQLRRLPAAPAAVRAALGATIAAVLVAAGIGVRFMVHNPGREVHDVGVAAIVLQLARDPNTLVCGALAALGAAALLWGQTDALVSRRAGRVLVLVGLALGLGPLISARLNPMTLHYPARLLNIAMPLAVLGGLAAWQRHRFVPRSGLGWAMAGLLAAFNLSWQATASLDWLRLRQHVLEVTAGPHAAPEGLISLTRAGLPTAQLGGSEWWMPSLSIVEQAIAGPTIHGIIEAKPGAFAPFVPSQPRTLPDLGRYGRHYAAALLEGPTPPAQQEETPAPADTNTAPAAPGPAALRRLEGEQPR